MSRWIRWFAGITVVVGLGFAIAGCSKPSTPAMGEKMSGEKMGGTKMGGEKMSGEKMSGEKMSGEKMNEKPGG